MSEYELRLLNDRGQTVAVYKMACLNGAHAETVIKGLPDISYAHYEIWRDMDKIGEGQRPTP
jgi:hypothetical protein